MFWCILHMDLVTVICRMCLIPDWLSCCLELYGEHLFLILKNRWQCYKELPSCCLIDRFLSALITDVYIANIHRSYLWLQLEVFCYDWWLALIRSSFLGPILFLYTYCHLIPLCPAINCCSIVMQMEFRSTYLCSHINEIKLSYKTCHCQWWSRPCQHCTI